MTKVHPIYGKDPDSHGPATVRTSQGNPSIGCFGWSRRDGEGNPKLHHGIDWLVVTGCPVYAAHDGKVFRCGEENGGKGYGQRIYLTGKSVITIYAHLSVQFIFQDDDVRAGHCLGLTGRSGNCSVDTPDHLHFEVRLGGLGKEHAVNPEWWLHGLGQEMGVSLPVG